MLANAQAARDLDLGRALRCELIGNAGSDFDRAAGRSRRKITVRLEIIPTPRQILLLPAEIRAFSRPIAVSRLALAATRGRWRCARRTSTEFRCGVPR
jgi:hypothetical protein